MCLSEHDYMIEAFAPCAAWIANKNALPLLALESIASNAVQCVVTPTTIIRGSCGGRSVKYPAAANLLVSNLAVRSTVSPLDRLSDSADPTRDR